MSGHSRSLVLLILVACTLVLVVFMLYQGRQEPVGDEGRPDPFEDLQRPSTDVGTSSGSVPTFSIRGSEGKPIAVRDFLQDAATDPDPYNKGTFFLCGTSPEIHGAATSVPYMVTYAESTQFFNVVILSEPIGSSRARAEECIASALGVSRDRLCALDAMVSVPIDVNEDLSGRSLGFARCGGSLPLPE